MNRLLPLTAFVILTLLLFVGLKNSADKTLIPSPLIDKPAPEFELPLLNQQGKLITKNDLLGQAYLLNVWASWCPPCRTEHPVIIKLAESGRLPVYGLNYKDAPANARRWLEQLGDPYVAVLADLDGRAAIDFGVYGAPESFLIDPQGRIRFKHVGPMTDAILRKDIFPLVDAFEPYTKIVEAIKP